MKQLLHHCSYDNFIIGLAVPHVATTSVSSKMQSTKETRGIAASKLF